MNSSVQFKTSRILEHIRCNDLRVVEHGVINERRALHEVGDVLHGFVHELGRLVRSILDERHTAAAISTR